MSFFNFLDLEADAEAAANFYGITTEDPEGRGNGDGRDAFRHAYISAKIKEYFLHLR